MAAYAVLRAPARVSRGPETAHSLTIYGLKGHIRPGFALFPEKSGLYTVFCIQFALHMAHFGRIFNLFLDNPIGFSTIKCCILYPKYIKKIKPDRVFNLSVHNPAGRLYKKDRPCLSLTNAGALQRSIEFVNWCTICICR